MDVSGIGGVASKLSTCALAPASRAMDPVLGLVGPDEVATLDMDLNVTKGTVGVPRNVLDLFSAAVGHPFVSLFGYQQRSSTLATTT